MENKEFTDFVCNTLDISIHAAQEGCDRQRCQGLHSRCKFQSTQPKRAATV